MGLGINGGGKLDFSPTLITKRSFSPEDNAKQIIKIIQLRIVKAVQCTPPFPLNPAVPFPLLPHALLLCALSCKLPLFLTLKL